MSQSLILITSALLIRSMAAEPNEFTRNFSQTEPNSVLTSETTNDLRRASDLIVDGTVLTRSEGSKFYWQTVEVRAVITNKTPFPIPKTIQVAHTERSADLPRTNCVLYLTKFQSSNYWTIVELPLRNRPF